MEACLDLQTKLVLRRRLQISFVLNFDVSKNMYQVQEKYFLHYGHVVVQLWLEGGSSPPTPVTIQDEDCLGTVTDPEVLFSLVV